MKKNEKKNINVKKQNKPSPMDVALSIARQDYSSEIHTDPLGSWTGVPEDKYERPIQDADDL